jgi:hypothetical protein
LATSHADAPTQSLLITFDAASIHDRSTMALVDELVALGPLPEQCGVVVAAGGRC